MTPCEKYREEIAAHVYGDLDPAAEAALERHLASCPGCREELRGFQRVALSLQPEVMFPEESRIDWDAFARSTVQRATGFRPLASQPSRAGILAVLWRVVSRAPALAAAGVSLLVVAGVALGTYAALGSRGAGPDAAAVAGGATGMILPSAMLTNIEERSRR
ncbi:MAG: zf-HC2 domain-containing protein [Acidobacteria bacterium]|nr:zf-HC2 domain-containing protein [Acidobacteriota bacterium]